MIQAFVIWYDEEDHRHKSGVLVGVDGYNSTLPTSWGLSKHCDIIATFQKPQALGFWLDGQSKELR